MIHIYTQYVGLANTWVKESKVWVSVGKTEIAIELNGKVSPVVFRIAWKLYYGNYRSFTEINGILFDLKRPHKNKFQSYTILNTVEKNSNFFSHFFTVWWCCNSIFWNSAWISSTLYICIVYIKYCQRWKNEEFFLYKNEWKELLVSTYIYVQNGML